MQGPSRRRAPAGSHWRPFALAIGVTVAVVLVVGVVVPSVGGGGAQPRAAVALAGDDAASTGTQAPVVTQATLATTTTTTTTTTAPPTTTVPPTTTTKAPKPGFGLLPQPAPTPVPLPPTNLAPVFSRVPTTNKVIFLGIDDGMVRDPAVLDYLREAKIPFTNFLVQGQADAGEEFWKQAQALGGTVESHTINHPDLTKVSAGQLQSEICGTMDDYQTRFGTRPTLFRPPYGAYNENVRAVAASCGYKAVVMWKGSTNDGRFDLQDGTALQPGDIVLMHWRTDLLRNLQKVVQTCNEQGFTIARLEDYLQ
jgi:peptidoglycan/xylan/chitin deacetylase (PgdA/CDA1 family)